MSRTVMSSLDCPAIQFTKNSTPKPARNFLMNNMIDINIKGVPYGIAAALPYMKQQKAGHISRLQVGH